MSEGGVRGEGRRPFHIGFKTSIITLFVTIVLVVSLTLVYLSFARISSMTQTAATTFINKVAELGAERIDSQFKAVRDNLEILAGLPALQSAELDDNPRLYSLMAAMLRNNPQLFSLYVGYEDGSFLQLDVIDRASSAFRSTLNAPEDATFRLFTILRMGATMRSPTVVLLSDNLIPIDETTGPTGYDPRKRPWYTDAMKDETGLLTGPYTFFATGEPGYTLRIPLREGRKGVVAGDILLGETESMLTKQGLGKSGLAFLFNDDGRIVAHPKMAEITEQKRLGSELPRTEDLDLVGLSGAIQAWRNGGAAQQFFADASGRNYVAAFQRIETSGNANIRLAVLAPLDEFFSEVITERNKLFTLAMLFVAATLPMVFWLGSILARSLRSLANETDRIQRFELADRPRLRSVISEIDELGQSVFTMRAVVRTFSSFVPKRIVQQLIESGAELSLGGTRREVTVLFTDVADFTAKTEKADPSDVMLFTSRYFGAMSETIMGHQGTIDKFIGDGMMAFWNAPADDPDHATHACRATLACVRRNEELNVSFVAEGWPAYGTRFGLHVGDAVVGNIGSADRMNYTALGATINLAARLEALNKAYGTRILVSEAVKRRAGDRFRFRSVDRIRPKGFAEAFTVYELCEERNDGRVDVDKLERWEKVYEAMVASGGDQGELVRRFAEVYPEDGISRYHASQLSGGSHKTAPSVEGGLK